MLAAALVVYSAVLLAELVGDKTIYTVTSLAMRVRAGVVLAVMAAAYSIKMAVAVLVGNVVQSRAAGFVSAGAFVISAVLLGFEREEAQPKVLASFLSLFLTEWGDPGQLVAAASAAKFQMPAVVWIAGTMAMLTKGSLALLLGWKLRDRLPRQWIRRVAAVCLCVLAVITLIDAMRR